MTFYDQALVLEAFVLTVATTMALTMYTMQSKKDYSSWGAGYVLFLKIMPVGKLDASLTLFIYRLANSKFHPSQFPWPEAPNYHSFQGMFSSCHEASGPPQSLQQINLQIQQLYLLRIQRVNSVCIVF